MVGGSGWLGLCGFGFVELGGLDNDCGDVSVRVFDTYYVRG